MALKVDVSHLLGIPYELGGTNPREGVDCRWTARAALELIFEDLESHEFPISADEEEIMLTRIRARETHWVKIGESAAAARKIGDVLHGRGEEGQSFVAVVVDQVTPLAITATKNRKVHVRTLRNYPGIEAVFRRAKRS
jgi:hypothetical protein